MFYSEPNRCLKKMCMNKLDIVFIPCILKRLICKILFVFIIFGSLQGPEIQYSAELEGEKRKSVFLGIYLDFVLVEVKCSLKDNQENKEQGKQKKGQRLDFHSCLGPKLAFAIPNVGRFSGQ